MKVYEPTSTTIALGPGGERFAPGDRVVFEGGDGVKTWATIEHVERDTLTIRIPWWRRALAFLVRPLLLARRWAFGVVVTVEVRRGLGVERRRYVLQAGRLFNREPGSRS